MHYSLESYFLHKKYKKLLWYLSGILINKLINFLS